MKNSGIPIVSRVEQVFNNRWLSLRWNGVFRACFVQIQLPLRRRLLRCRVTLLQKTLWVSLFFVYSILFFILKMSLALTLDVRFTWIFCDFVVAEKKTYVSRTLLSGHWKKKTLTNGDGVKVDFRWPTAGKQWDFPRHFSDDEGIAHVIEPVGL